MPKKINYTLTENELLTIKQAIKNHAEHRVRERARIIRLLHKGHKHEEIADLLAFSRSQVYWWHKRWREDGLAGLSDKPRSGRPLASNDELKAVIEQVLETDPQSMGYAFTVWNAPRLLVYLKEKYQVTMHSNTLRNLLAKMDYVYRRPKHDLASLQDKEAKAIAQENLDELKKKPRPGKSNFSVWTKRP
jgi:putative transposase